MGSPREWISSKASKDLPQLRWGRMTSKGRTCTIWVIQIVSTGEGHQENINGRPAVIIRADKAKSR